MSFVILTASSMKKELEGTLFSGRCVTAFDMSGNRIVRLVRNRLGAPMENPYCDHYNPLDIFEIKVFEECPVRCQTENVLSDYRTAKFLGKYEGSIQELYYKISNINYGDHSFMLDGSYKLNDISPFKHSIEMIKVTDLIIKGKKCSFRTRYNKYVYVSITDPKYLQEGEKEHLIGDAFLVISIPTDDYKGKGYFKFVATVLPINPWSSEEDEELLYEYKKGWTGQMMSMSHKRSEDEIRRRIAFVVSNSKR